MHFSEKPLTEKVNIGDELINNTIWGLNLSYNKNFMWLTNLVNKIPTVNATAPSTLSIQGEFAQLIPHKKKTGSNSGSSFIDDFETSQTYVLLILGSWLQRHTTNLLMPCSQRLLFQIILIMARIGRYWHGTILTVCLPKRIRHFALHI